jgi:hypothetical protein
VFQSHVPVTYVASLMLGAEIDAARAHLRHWNNSVAQNVAELKQPDLARRDAFDYMNGICDASIWSLLEA